MRADHDELVFRLRMLPVWKDCERPVVHQSSSVPVYLIVDIRLDGLDSTTLSIFNSNRSRMNACQLFSAPAHRRRKQKNGSIELINQHMPRGVYHLSTTGGESQQNYPIGTCPCIIHHILMNKVAIAVQAPPPPDGRRPTQNPTTRRMENGR